MHSQCALQPLFRVPPVRQHDRLDVAIAISRGSDPDFAPHCTPPCAPLRRPCGRRRCDRYWASRHRRASVHIQIFLAQLSPARVGSIPESGRQHGGFSYRCDRRQLVWSAQQAAPPRTGCQTSPLRITQRCRKATSHCS